MNRQRVSSPSSEVAVTVVLSNLKGIGGTERRLFELAELGTSVKLSFQFLVLSQENKSWTRTTLAGPEIYSKVKFGLSDVLRILLEESKKPKIVVSSGFTATLTLCLLKGVGLVPLPLIVLRNGSFYTRIGVRIFFQRIFRNQVNLFLTNSYSIGEEVVAQGIERSKVRVLPSGLPEVWKSRSSGKLSGGFVSVGNYRSEKNLEGLIAAYSRSGVSRTLTIFTDEGEKVRDIAKRYSASAGAIQVVESAVVTPEILGEYGSLIHVSHSESRPRAVMEALSVGLIVIGSRAGDIPMMTRTGEARIVDSFDLDAIARAIAEVDKVLDQKPSKIFVDFPSAHEYARGFRLTVERALIPQGTSLSSPPEDEGFF